MSVRRSSGEPASPAGHDVARLIQAFKVRVAFLPTRGSGATPWRRLIVLDTSYRDQGQAESPTRVALVAHELVHVLQRELDDPEFWPQRRIAPFAFSEMDWRFYELHGGRGLYRGSQRGD